MRTAVVIGLACGMGSWAMAVFSELNKAKRQMVFLLHIPSGLDTAQLESDVRAKLPKSDDSKISIQMG